LYGGDSSSHPVRNGIVDALREIRQEAEQLFEDGEDVSGVERWPCGAETAAVAEAPAQIALPAFDARDAALPSSPRCSKLSCEEQNPDRIFVP
jgi:hypothetical protein